MAGTVGTGAGWLIGFHCARSAGCLVGDVARILGLHACIFNSMEMMLYDEEEVGGGKNN